MAAATTYARLSRRNRLVGTLRIAVPVAGALVFVGLIGQIWLSSLSVPFEIGQVTVTPEAINVASPEYVGVMEDGSRYRVWANTARASTSQTDIIDLFEAEVVLDRADGVQLMAQAARAQLDTSNRQVRIPGLADVSDSTGTTGTLTNSVFDWTAQVLTTDGPVDIDYADGSSVVAEGLVYDAGAIVWTFKRSVVTLPSTPGEDVTGSAEPAAASGVVTP
jgi:lipopolysaccharide export system protein LptC